MGDEESTGIYGPLTAWLIWEAEMAAYSAHIPMGPMENAKDPKQGDKGWLARLFHERREGDK